VSPKRAPGKETRQERRRPRPLAVFALLPFFAALSTAAAQSPQLERWSESVRERAAGRGVTPLPLWAQDHNAKADSRQTAQTTPSAGTNLALPAPLAGPIGLPDGSLGIAGAGGLPPQAAAPQSPSPAPLTPGGQSGRVVQPPWSGAPQGLPPSSVAPDTPAPGPIVGNPLPPAATGEPLAPIPATPLPPPPAVPDPTAGIDGTLPPLSAFDPATLGQPGNAVYERWDRFYKVQEQDAAEGERLLREILQVTPGDAQAWLSLGYLLQRQGREAEALDAFKQAAKIRPDDEDLQLQIAYTEASLDQVKAAKARFEDLSYSSDKRIAQISCLAAQNLALPSQKLLPDPYFGEIATNPSYESRFDYGLFPAKARLGRTFGPNQRGEVYLYGDVNYDTRSEGGEAPIIFNENTAGAGIGANYRPFEEVPLTVFGEVGASYDLLFRDRNRWRADVTVGAAMFSAHGDNRQWCPGDELFPLTAFADVGGTLGTYSREDWNGILQTDARAGLNLLRSKYGTIQGYGLVRVGADTNQDFFNNFVEFGPGLAYRFPTDIPLTLRVENRTGYYFPTDRANNPYDPLYNNTRVELGLFYRF